MTREVLAARQIGAKASDVPMGDLQVETT